MAGLIIVFALGIANFAMHKAVLESGHPLLEQLPWVAGEGRFPTSLALEFLVLLGVLALARFGWNGAVLGYAFYTACNAASAWYILKERL